MDAQYIFECTWKIEESAVTDGRLFNAVKNTSKSDMLQIKHFKNWDDAAEAINKSYPAFFEHLKALGIEVSLHD